MVKISVEAKLKISGSLPKVGKIISKFASYDYSLAKEGEAVILDVIMPTQGGLNQLIRHLGGKRNRKTTVIEFLGGRSGGDG